MDEDESLSINRGKDSSPFQMNRGFELLLRDTRREPPKSFSSKVRENGLSVQKRVSFLPRLPYH